MTKTNEKASMLLISSAWLDKPSFKMIPISENCPYTECLYDPTSKVFVIISKMTKTSLHMLPRLDDNGDPKVLKTGKRPNGKIIQESRLALETLLEYYVEEQKDIITLIDIFAMNADVFDYKAILNAKVVEIPETPPKSTIIL